MNTKLLRRAEKRILKEPRQFQMEKLYTDYIYDIEIPKCGTAACIAGWVNCITHKSKPSIQKCGYHDAITARDSLEIDSEQSNRLFYFEEWPERFKRVTKEGTPAFARQAVRRIEHFIKTKGAE